MNIGKLPIITKAQIGDGYKIKIQFDTGEEMTVDFKDYIFDKPNRGLIGQLREPEQFAQFKVEFGTLEWANGCGFSPDLIYQMATEQAGYALKYVDTDKSKIETIYNIEEK
jgi:hypothetical protein